MNPAALIHVPGEPPRHGDAPGEVAAALVALAEPGQNSGLERRRVQIAVGHQHQVGVADIVDAGIGRDAQLAQHIHRLTVYGGHPHFEARRLRLAEQPTKVFTKDELLREVWGFRAMGRTRTLDSHASRVRRKLAPHTETPYVINEWGVGYRLMLP